MNRPRNGRDWVGLIALILTITLSLMLLITTIGTVVFDRRLTEAGSRLLSGIGLALAGAVATYIGYGIRGRKDHDE